MFNFKLQFKFKSLPGLKRGEGFCCICRAPQLLRKRGVRSVTRWALCQHITVIVTVTTGSSDRAALRHPVIASER